MAKEKELSLYTGPKGSDYRYKTAESARGVGIGKGRAQTVSQLWEEVFRTAWRRADPYARERSYAVKPGEREPWETPKHRRREGRSRMLSLLKSDEMLNNPAFQRAGIHPEAVLELGREKLREIHETTPKGAKSGKDVSGRYESNRWMGGVRFSEEGLIMDPSQPLEGGSAQAISELDEIDVHPLEGERVQRLGSQNLRFGPNIDNPEAQQRRDSRFDPDWDLAKDPLVESHEGRAELTHGPSKEAYRFDPDPNRMPDTSLTTSERRKGYKAVSPSKGRSPGYRANRANPLGRPQSSWEGMEEAGAVSQPQGDLPQKVEAEADQFDFDFAGYEEERVQEAKQSPEGIHALSEDGKTPQQIRKSKDLALRMAQHRFKTSETLLTGKRGTTPAQKLQLVDEMSQAYNYAVPRLAREQVQDVISESPVAQGSYADNERREIKDAPRKTVYSPDKDPSGRYVDDRGKPYPRGETPIARPRWDKEMPTQGQYDRTTEQRVVGITTEAVTIEQRKLLEEERKEKAAAGVSKKRVAAWTSKDAGAKSGQPRIIPEQLPKDRRGVWDPSQAMSRKTPGAKPSTVGDPTPDILPDLRLSAALRSYGTKPPAEGKSGPVGAPVPPKETAMKVQEAERRNKEGRERREHRAKLRTALGVKKPEAAPGAVGKEALGVSKKAEAKKSRARKLHKLKLQKAFNVTGRTLGKALGPASLAIAPIAAGLSLSAKQAKASVPNYAQELGSVLTGPRVIGAVGEPKGYFQTGRPTRVGQASREDFRQEHVRLKGETPYKKFMSTIKDLWVSTSPRNSWMRRP